jgi:putative ABC transport system ATP-binding protein
LADSTTSLPIIRLTGVFKSYVLGARRVDALRGIDLCIAQPGFYGIMGASGSGKSTLLHLVAGLDRPDKGSVEVAGCRVDALSESELTLYRRHTIGIIFQQFNLISTLTALDNVTLPAMLDGMPTTRRRSRGMELLAALGLAERADHRPDAMSGGEQQRVAIARSLMFEPSLVLADEPTGNLDSASSDHMWRLLGAVARERNITVLMVTHEPAAAAHCQRVILLRDGRVTGSFDVDGIDAPELATRSQQPGR